MDLTPQYEQLRLFEDGIDIEPEPDDLEVFEQVITEREFDAYGNLTKETRTILRPKHRDLTPRTPMPIPPPPRIVMPPPPRPLPHGHWMVNDWDMGYQNPYCHSAYGMVEPQSPTKS